MEPEEIKSHIYYQFKEIAKLEQEKKKLVDEAKAQITKYLKEFIPGISNKDKEITKRVNEIKKASMELKENYYCDCGRVIYYPPWLKEKEGVRIQGIQSPYDSSNFFDGFDAIDTIVQGFILQVSSEEANNPGGEED